MSDTNVKLEVEFGTERVVGKDHAKLENLDYMSSGHTGFQPAGDYVTNTELENKHYVVSQPGKGLSANDFTDSYKTKLEGLENYNDSEVRSDIASLELGVQANENAIDAIRDGASLDSFSDVELALTGKVDKTSIGSINGVAGLDSNGRVPSTQLPSYVDDVLEYASVSNFPATGETGKIYVAKDTNLTYRWGGSDYVEISPSLALGETPQTAYRGDRGKTAYNHATEAKISTSKTQKLYKVGVTSQGHISSAEEVTKEDLTSFGLEDSSNKVTGINETNTDSQYPSAKSVYDMYEQMSSEMENNAKTGTSIDTDDSAYWKAKMDFGGNTGQDTNIITYTCDGTETGDYYFAYNSTNYQFAMPTVSSGDVIYFNTDTLKLYLSTTEITTTTASTGTLITMQNTPNPDYPQEIKVVTGENTIKVENKNFFNEDKILEISGWTKNSDGYYTGLCSNFYTYFYANRLTNVFKENTRYSIQWNGYCEDSSSNFRFRIVYTDGDAQDLATLTTTPSLKTSTTKANKTVKSIYFYYGGNGTAYIKDIQIEEGETSTSYVPHQEQTYPITLPEGMELCEGDKIKGTPNNWNRFSQTNKINLKDMNWTVHPDNQPSDTNLIMFYSTITDRLVSANVLPLCNHLTYKGIVAEPSAATTKGVGFTFYYNVNAPTNKTIYVIVNKSIATTSQEFISWANTNNVILYYPLATPIETQITDTTLINQLNDLYNKAKTYQGVTHITQSNAEIPFILKLNYKKSNILRIQALEQAILSQGANV